MFARERMGDESRRGESDGGNREEFKTKRVVCLSRRGAEQQCRPERAFCASARDVCKMELIEYELVLEKVAGERANRERAKDISFGERSEGSTR